MARRELGGPDKTTHSFPYANFWAIRRRIALFAPKCLAQIIYY